MRLSILFSCISLSLWAQDPNQLLDDAYELELSSPDSAIELYLEAVNLYKTNGNSEGIGRAYSYAAIVCSDQGRYQKAENFLDSSNLYWTIADYQKGLGSNLNNQANIFQYQGFYRLALTSYERAAELFAAIPDSINQMIAFSNIGRIYNQLGDHEQSLKLYKDYLNYAVLIGDSQTIAYANHDIGIAFHRLYKLDSAEARLRAAKEVANSVSDLYLDFIIDKNLADVLLDQGSTEEAKQLALISLAYADELNNPFNLLLGHHQLARVYLQENDDSAALIEATKALSIADESGFEVNRIELNQLISQIYFGVKNFEKAHEHLSLSLRLKDEWNNKNKAKEILELQYRFQTAEKDKAISQSKLELVEKDLIISRKNRQTLIAISSLLFIILLGAWLSARARLKVSRQRQQIVEIKASQAQKVHEASVLAEEHERKRIATELHDGVSGLLSGVKMHLEAHFKRNKSKAPETEEILNFLTEANQEVRRISHDLAGYKLEHQGFEMALTEFASTLASKNREIKLQVQTEPNWAKSAEAKIVYRASQELIHNAIRHGKASKISLDLKQEGSSFNLQVIDNGEGAKNLNFGFGLNSIQNQMQKLGANLEVNSEKEFKVSIIK